MSAIFNPREFEIFCRGLTIESRDEGLVPFKFNQAQVRTVKAVAKALEDGRRTILVLKSRQIGLSTLGLGLDLYWASRHPGIHGMLVTDSDSNREAFRMTLDAMIGEGARAKEGPVKRHNREHLIFRNRSRLIYEVAGLKSGGTMARGKGLNYCHGTECSSWGERNAVDSLFASFSQRHQHRLYLFESTARGFNLWHDMCKAAKKSDASVAGSQAFIFVTWWHSDLFQFPPGTNEYRVYGKGDPDPHEREWIRAVKLIYKHEITRAQLAWWRWQAEDRGVTPENLLEDFPPTEELAWKMTGAQFFSTSSLTKLMTATKRQKAKRYMYHWGKEFSDLKKSRTDSPYAHHTVWEEPVNGAYYTIGADPCGGTGSTMGDDAVIEVLRCYADGVEQVAEFRAPGIPGYCFAWTLASLANEYKPAVVNLEINGAGISVADELSRIEFSGSYYIYRRIDSLGGGGILHWKTNSENKRWVMEQLRSLVERDMILVRSSEAVDQMRNIEQSGVYIGASSSQQTDDCVMALAMAVEAWTKNWLGTLQAMNMMRQKRDEKGQVIERTLENVLEKQLEDMLKREGLGPKEAEPEAAFGERVYERMETDDMEEF
ncbi:MAG: hypothetical protein ACRD52_00735 [Candidatus Acidiferrales bacterium]